MPGRGGVRPGPARVTGAEARLEKARRDLAVFDTRANMITMSGGVVLTQCKNVLRGDRLMVDMTTGVSRVESDSGKVQALFIQGSEGCGSKGSAPAPMPPPTSLIPGKQK